MMLAVAPIYDLNPCTSHRWVTSLGVGRTTGLKKRGGEKNKRMPKKEDFKVTNEKSSSIKADNEVGGTLKS